VKRQKNDAADAEAICEASQRPTMRFVQTRSEAAQAAAVVFPRSSGAPAHTDYQRLARSSGRIRAGRRKGTGSWGFSTVAQ
jgi:transposase